MDPKNFMAFASYSGAVDQRVHGASEAAKYGAVGAVVRSLTLFQDDIPHTGTLRYKEEFDKIPAVAISTNDANLLSKTLKEDPNLDFYFETHCQMFKDKLSYNVIGELTGSEKPNQYIVVSGHLDSWDMGDGSHDDGAGCVQAIEALRLFKALNIRPKKTIRAVMYMNEENGLRGGTEYAKQVDLKKEKHVAALESDSGGFSPRRFRVDGASAKNLKKITNWQSLFAPYGIHVIQKGYAGADISPLKKEKGGPVLIGLLTDTQRYFKYHHTTIDTFDKINKRELELGAAAMASMIYLIDKYGL
jgi:Zn-dependent M28 family amino/carboxypeptidase